MRKINNILILILIFCLCLCGCSKKEDFVINGSFGTGETNISESITETSIEDEFAIKDDVILSTEEIDKDTNISLNSLQQAKINEIEESLKSQNTEVTENNVTQLLNTDEFINISDSDKSSLAIQIVERINSSATSETLSSELVYKHASSYETSEIIIDEEAPVKVYTEEELESMHSSAEELYQQQQTAETFEFDD